MGGSTKQALLQALSAAEGTYISGQQLAEALGVSRAAVHKAAQALSAQGYALDSAPRRGYRLAARVPNALILTAVNTVLLRLLMENKAVMAAVKK